MARPVLLIAGAGVFAGLVLAYGAFAWLETEDRVLAAAEAEGRAVLGSVRAGIVSSIDASREVDKLVSDRLFELAARVETELAEDPDPEGGSVRRLCEEHGLAGLALLGDDFSVRSAVLHKLRAAAMPSGSTAFDGDRVAQIDAAQMAERARDAGLAKAGRIAFGFGESVFGARPIFLVGVAAPKLHGYLLLRQDAAPLSGFRKEAGVEKLLREAATSPGIAYLVMQSADGRVLAADDPSRADTAMSPPSTAATWRRDAAGARVLDVAMPVGEDHLRVGLTAGPVEELIASGRRDVAVFSAVALAAGGAVFLLLVLRARREAELAAQENLASLGRLAAGVAHEIRSPLNALSMAAQRLQREAAPSEEPAKAKFAELTGALRGGIARLDATIREFLALGMSGPPPEKKPVDVAALVDEVIAAEGANVARRPPASPLVVTADRALLGKALANLVRNAHQIAPGTVSVAWRRDGARGVIEVEDGGPGVAAADRTRVFEPFFTKRPGGTGIGLAVAKDAVERQGGRIGVGDAASGGARFAIEMPAEGA